MKNFIIAIIVIGLLAFGIYFITKKSSNDLTPKQEATAVETPVATTTQPDKNPNETIIGKSVEGRDIAAYHFGTGPIEIIFIGGIHGGYGWNTSLLSYEIIDYLRSNPDVIPNSKKVTVIPVLNPDGLYKTVGTTSVFTKADVPAAKDEQIAGRFNANNVDLNRNFDCDWKADAVWQNKKVSGGNSAFSEPESQAIKNYVEKVKPVGIVTYYSAVGGVFSSNCHNGVLEDTKIMTDTYAKASGYRAYKEFNFYEITGDMVNWFAKQNIPAISVLLTNHTDTEWTKNKKGVDAIIKLFDTAKITE